MPKSQTVSLSLGQGLALMVGLPALPTWKTKDRPKKAMAGTLGYNLQTHCLEYWDGFAWRAAQMNKV